MQESQLSGEITRRTFGMKIACNGGQETRQTRALTSWKGGCCGRKGWMRLSRKRWGWDRTITFAEQKRSSSVFEAKAKADQVKTTQQRMLRHHPAWPLGREIRTGSPAAIALCLDMSCSMLMSHIVLFPGADAREGTVVACSLFIKTVYLVESLCLTFVPK